MPEQQARNASLSRRSLFASTAAVGALGALGALPRGAGADGHAIKPARKTGIQLYTLRGAMDQDPLGTLTALAGMGYTNMEFAGHAGVEPRVIRGWLNDLGLEAPAGHVNPNEVKADPGPAIEAAKALGHEYIIIAWIPPEQRQSIDDYRGWAEVLNRTGEAAKAAGMRMAYHNHDFEFIELDGVIPQELLMSETDPELVDFELDFFWVAKAGLDIGTVLAQAPERYRLAHIKDMDAEGNMVAVGAGEIDFAGLLASDAASYIRYPFVEHDNPVDPFQSAAFSHFYLSRILAQTG